MLIDFSLVDWKRGLSELLDGMMMNGFYGYGGLVLLVHDCMESHQLLISLPIATSGDSRLPSLSSSRIQAFHPSLPIGLYVLDLS